MSLQSKGHAIAIYTSHHSNEHCFEETKDGRLKVIVKGDFLPRQFFGYFHLLFACLRSIWLAFYILLFCPSNYDLIIVDQISVAIPILRWCSDKVRNRKCFSLPLLFI